jgi:hypothetical protein
MSFCVDALGLQAKVLEHIKLLQDGASSDNELSYFFHELVRVLLAIASGLESAVVHCSSRDTIDFLFLF